MKYTYANSGRGFRKCSWGAQYKCIHGFVSTFAREKQFVLRSSVVVGLYTRTQRAAAAPQRSKGEAQAYLLDMHGVKLYRQSAPVLRSAVSSRGAAYTLNIMEERRYVGDPTRCLLPAKSQAARMKNFKVRSRPTSYN